MVDHVSDTFVAPNVPLHALIDAARRGNAQLVEETAQIFMEHASKLIEVYSTRLFKSKKIIFTYFRLLMLLVQCLIKLKVLNWFV